MWFSDNSTFFIIFGLSHFICSDHFQLSDTNSDQGINVKSPDLLSKGLTSVQPAVSQTANYTEKNYQTLNMLINQLTHYRALAEILGN